MGALKDQSYTPMYGGRGNPVYWISVVDIGGTGAPTPNTTLSDPGWTWTRTGAGVYDVTFPFARRGDLTPKIYKTPVPTVFGWNILAIDITAGTATIRFNNAAGAATDPANGDIVGAVFVGAGRE